MKKYLSFILLCLVLNFSSKAQYVTIPDTTFVNWLHANGFAACMNGNQLDTTCTAVTTETVLSCHAVPIHDLTGIQYFRHLDTLDCSNDSLYILPSLPATLTYLNCDYNNLPVLPALPPNLLYLSCALNYLTALPALPASLQNLGCTTNQLTSLPALPAGLLNLGCNDNQITALPPTLPPGLLTLLCSNNPISVLPALPPTLRMLLCEQNQLTHLPALPDSLQELDCNYNSIVALPTLTDSLQYVFCAFNQLTVLPAIPAGVVIFECYNNMITGLPALPPLLQVLDCSYNNLTALPPFQAITSQINCSHNQITTLPAMSGTLGYYFQVDCSYNQLTTVTNLPQNMSFFNCSNNPNLACLPVLSVIVDSLDFRNTAITCLPNYGTVGLSFPPFDSVPLCSMFNPGGCTSYANISGKVYYDLNANCQFDSADAGLNYVKVSLYGSGGDLQQQVYTGGAGDYSFMTNTYDTYSIVADTTNFPFALVCPTTDTTITTLSADDSLSYNNNFSFTCYPQGIDLGVQSIVNNYIVPRPSSVITLYTVAGDLTDLYGAHCAAGVSGQVQLIINGQAGYAGTAPGAITPNSVTGNTVTWNIADFGVINDRTAFNLLLKIDSAATAGTLVCITVNVTPDSTDYNPTNNTGNFCFTIIDALDPNEKEVYPSTITEAGQWLTYTIRFQNTGTAPAVNVHVNDTLDHNLDPSTFQLLAYSAKNITQILGNVVIFNFPNINLPDSATSNGASRGFVQYRIKTASTISRGDVVKNTASIYFDLNPAVVTNTVTDSTPNCIRNGSSSSHTICQGDTVFSGHHAYTHAGNYTDTLTNAGGCDSLVTLALAVNPLPVVTLTIACTRQGEYFCYWSTSLSAQHSTCDAIFWQLNGLPLNGATGDTLSLADTVWTPRQNLPGTFVDVQLFQQEIVCFTGYNSCGSFTTCDTVTLIGEGISTINPNNVFRLYPNPADDYVNIDFDASYTGATILVKDITGREVLQTRLITSPQSLPTGNLPAGVYVVKLNANGQVGARLVVKE